MKNESTASERTTRERVDISNKRSPPANEHSMRKRRRESESVPFSEEESERIQGLLNKVLGPEYISFRPGGGGQKVSYIEGWKALNLANEIFGFNGWSSELISTQVDYFDTHNSSGRISMGLSVVVRITIKDGTYHEDFGYGYIDNAKNKAMAFEKCKKEAFTDGLKRCLRCFGNVLGNCLYDRTIISKIQKVKVSPPELEASDFYRHPLIERNERRKRQDGGVNVYRAASENLANGMEDQDSERQNEGAVPNELPNYSNGLKTPVSARNGSKITKGNRNGSNPHHNGQSDKNESTSRADNGKSYDIGDFDDSLVFSDDIAIEEEELGYDHGLDEYEMQILMHKNNANLSTKERPTGLVSEGETQEKAAIVNLEKEENEKMLDQSKNGHESKGIKQNTMFISAKKADLLQESTGEAIKIPSYDAKFLSPSMRRTIDQTKSVPIRRTEVPSLLNKNMKNSSQNEGEDRATSLSSFISGTSSQNKRLIGVPLSQKPSYKKSQKN